MAIHYPSEWIYSSSRAALGGGLINIRPVTQSEFGAFVFLEGH